MASKFPWFFHNEPQPTGEPEELPPGRLTPGERVKLRSRMDKALAGALSAEQRGDRQQAKQFRKTAERLEQQLMDDLNDEGYQVSRQIHRDLEKLAEHHEKLRQEMADQFRKQQEDLLKRLPLQSPHVTPYTWRPEYISINSLPPQWIDFEAMEPLPVFEYVKAANPNPFVNEKSAALGVVEIHLLNEILAPDGQRMPHNTTQLALKVIPRLEGWQSRLHLAQALGWTPIVDLEESGAFIHWHKGLSMMSAEACPTPFVLTQEHEREGDLMDVTLANTLPGWDRGFRDLGRLFGWWHEHLVFDLHSKNHDSQVGYGLRVSKDGQREVFAGLSYGNIPKLILTLGLSDRVGAQIEINGTASDSPFSVKVVTTGVAMALEMMRTTLMEYPELSLELAKLNLLLDQNQEYVPCVRGEKVSPICFCGHAKSFGNDCNHCSVRLSQLLT